MSNNKDASGSIIKGSWYAVDMAVRKYTTKIYDGVSVSNNNDGRWNIQYNGETHPIKPYGSISPTVDMKVKVFIPQGNQNLAFFM